MKKELQLIKEQNELLKQVIETQKELIQELRKNQPIISIPSVWTVPCQHEYPTPWYGTVPPHCKKCGQQAPSYTVTCTSNVDPDVKCGAW